MASAPWSSPGPGLPGYAAAGSHGPTVASKIAEARELVAGITPHVGSGGVSAAAAAAPSSVPAGFPPGHSIEREKGSRGKISDTVLQAAIERGGQDAQTAMNLAMLQTLQRLAGQKDPEDLDGLLEEDAAELDSTISKMASGAKGAAALYKLHEPVERHPAA
eukprot:5292873-Amphidinium_carterae.3